MLIGLTGFKHSGKSTAAKYLQANYHLKRLNFKDGLIKELTQKFPDLLRVIMEETDPILFNDEPNLPELFDIKPPSIRALMMNYGTEVRRKDHTNYWVNFWEGEYHERPDYIHNTVVDDVRFLNEAECIKRHGGIIIRITRNDIKSGGDHQSETEMLQITPDVTIETTMGGFDKLYTELDEVMKVTMV